MTDERYLKLSLDYEDELTEEEIMQGWHWCQDWDFMLLGPGMPEMSGCNCFKE